MAANAKAMEDRRLARERDAERTARIEAARKKDLAMSGIASDEVGHKRVQLSKKDQKAMADMKRGKGDRTAKTGARAKKFDAAAHKQAEDDKKTPESNKVEQLRSLWMLWR